MHPSDKSRRPSGGCPPLPGPGYGPEAIVEKKTMSIARNFFDYSWSPDVASCYLTPPLQDLLCFMSAIPSRTQIRGNVTRVLRSKTVAVDACRQHSKVSAVKSGQRSPSSLNGVSASSSLRTSLPAKQSLLVHRKQDSVMRYVFLFPRLEMLKSRSRVAPSIYNQCTEITGVIRGRYASDTKVPWLARWGTSRVNAS